MSDEPTRVYTPTHPAPSAPSDDRRYALHVKEGQVYAITYKDGWIPTHAIGPFSGHQLATPAAQQDWSHPIDARTWNARFLVNLCDAEHQRLMQGRSRLSTAIAASGRRAIAGRKVTEKPVLAEVKAQAVDATQGDDRSGAL